MPLAYLQCQDTCKQQDDRIMIVFEELCYCNIIGEISGVQDMRKLVRGYSRAYGTVS